MANLRKEARGRDCQIRIPAFVISIQKPLCWHITAWREPAAAA